MADSVNKGIETENQLHKSLLWSTSQTNPPCPKSCLVQWAIFKRIHFKYEKGDNKHKANMEHMAEEVRKRLASTQYGGKPCTIMWIGGEENLVIEDEEHLIAFLDNNENQKADDVLQYQPIRFLLYAPWVKITARTMRLFKTNLKFYLLDGPIQWWRVFQEVRLR